MALNSEKTLISASTVPQRGVPNERCRLLPCVLRSVSDRYELLLVLPGVCVGGEGADLKDLDIPGVCRVSTTTNEQTKIICDLT